MTEAEWLSSADPEQMLKFLGGKASERKVRLLACALCRTAGHSPTHPTAVQVIERYADGAASAEELEGAFEAVQRQVEEAVAEEDFEKASRLVAIRDCAYRTTGRGAWVVRAIADKMPKESRDLLRDIFGNPFRPVPTYTTWLTPTAASLARAIYAERAWDRLPILADALEEAGCDHPDVLTHCRGDERHVRGCWVIDLLLGRE